MTESDGPKPPWVSKGRVNRAGERIRQNALQQEDAVVLDAWRDAHKYVLNTFQALLRGRTRGTNIVVAQRLKRRLTIIDKLEREPQMELARMDDLAGCRIIFSDLAELNAFRSRFLKARFKHKVKNSPGKYDYITKPKVSGYRGIHDIYGYNSGSTQGRPYRGLQLELQYRTLPQHAWATAVELVGRITESQPKFDRGDERYREFFRLASEIIARVHEGCTSLYSKMPVSHLLAEFNKIESEIHLLRMLRGLNTVYDGPANGGDIILQFSQAGHLTVHQLAIGQSATTEYFRLERENPKDDIVLVNAGTFEEIRSAYRNYFSDPREFLRLMDEGLNILRQSESKK